MGPIDEWCIGKIEGVLLWLEEWFSVSQKLVERGIVGFYVVALLCEPISNAALPGPTKGPPSWFAMTYGGWLLWGMYSELRMPAATRRVHRRTSAWYRIGWLITLPCCALLSCLPPHDVGADCTAGLYLLTLVLRVAMSYVIVANVEGEPGRRRKFSLSKIKELFGTSWMPHPVAAGW